MKRAAPTAYKRKRYGASTKQSRSTKKSRTINTLSSSKVTPTIRKPRVKQTAKLSSKVKVALQPQAGVISKEISTTSVAKNTAPSPKLVTTRMRAKKAGYVSARKMAQQRKLVPSAKKTHALNTTADAAPKHKSRARLGVTANTAPGSKNRRQSREAQTVPTAGQHEVWSSFFQTFTLYPFHTLTAIAMSIVLIVATQWMYTTLFVDLPVVTELTDRPSPVSSKILDRNGTVLYTLYDDENRTIVPLEAISPSAIQATIAIEDKDFFSHHGFSLRGITRAVLANFKNEQIQGGSTITQQLVKNRLLSTERTLQRKVRELILSILVEQTYTKEQILEMYLNEVSYGGSTYGIEEAARRYFDKPSADLTLAESALIAGLPQAPSLYSPFGPNPETASLRQQEVLRRMVEDGYISAEQAAQATQETLVFRTDQTDIQAPHFVMYVRQLLAEEYGEDSVYTKGLIVKTTLDLPLQQQVQKIVTDEITSLKPMRISNGAAVVTNPQTGELLAMVGSTNYFDFAHDGQVNVTLRPRQPGSSIKPLTYALALEKGMTMTSKIDDSPVTYSIAGSPPYAPKNYDGKFHGQVSLKEALGSSYNIPAVKLLASVGINTLIDRAQAAGITTWDDRSRFGLSLTLGGGEVRMVDMATAYGSFANNGYRTDINPIIEVRDYQGKVLYKNECVTDASKCAKQRVWEPRVAYMITNILSDNKARTPAFGALSTLTIPNQEVAVKTGTTNSLRDNWTIGYTSDRVVAVWVGNNDNTPMSYVASGITGASPIWNKIIRTQLSETDPHLFTVPQGMVKLANCSKNSTADYFIAGMEPRSCADLAPNVATPARPASNSAVTRRRIRPL